MRSPVTVALVEIMEGNETLDGDVLTPMSAKFALRKRSPHTNSQQPLLTPLTKQVPVRCRSDVDQFFLK